jgi:hypothetical protein
MIRSTIAVQEMALTNTASDIQTDVFVHEHAC